VIITHGRAKRRMMTYAVELAARMARERVPDLIADAFTVHDSAAREAS
jgi:fatty acid/phospholipid biosynthesis enzyme